MTIPRLLTMPEVARRLNLHVHTIRQVVAADDGPVTTKISDRVLIREDHLMDWLDKRARTGRQQVAA